MSSRAQRVLRDALKLSPVERAELVERILASFAFPERQRIDGLWAAEVEARIDAYERGELMRAVVAGLADLDQGREVSLEEAKARLGVK